MTKAHLALAAISATTALGLTIPTTSYASPTPTPTDMTESPAEPTESPEPTNDETGGETSPEPSEPGGSPEASPTDETGLPAAFKEAVTKSTSTSSSGTIDFDVTKEGEKKGSVKAKVSYAYQPKPKPMGTFKIMNLVVNGETKNASPVVLLDGETVYINPAALSPPVEGKQWLKIPLSKVPGATGFAEKLSDPNLPQRILAAYEGVHVVGQETVDGVPLTRYAGTI